MDYKTWIEVSKSSLRHNIGEIKSLLRPGVALMVVVKANAYGGGLAETVQCSTDIVDWYGVDSLEEARKVRQYSNKPILILGYVANYEFQEVVDREFRVVVYNYGQAYKLEQCTTKRKPAYVHIKIDVGLSRLGLLPMEVDSFANRIAALRNIRVEGVYTHFARLLDDSGDPIYLRQLTRFLQSVNKLRSNGVYPRLLHAASSMSAVLYPDTHLDLVRIGIGAYGLWGRLDIVKIIERHGKMPDLQPVLSLRTRVVSVKQISRGVGIGYMHSQIARKETTVAVLGIGYADGIDRRLATEGAVLIRGRRASFLGRIAMTMCVVDVTGLESVSIGDTAVVLGRSKDEEISAYDHADIIGSSTYEVLSRINPLVPRIITE